MANLSWGWGMTGRIWIIRSFRFTVRLLGCREENGKWFAAEDDSFFGEIGPFSSIEEVIKHIDKNKLFGPWGSQQTSKRVKSLNE